MKMPNLPRLVCFAFLLSFSIPPGFAQDAPRNLIKNVEAVGQHLDGRTAMRAVAFMQNYWRHAGNQDFNLCMDYFATALSAGGFAEADSFFRLSVRDTLLPQAHTWQPFDAELRLVAPFDSLLHSLTQAKMSLCVNSHSTPLPGVSMELVFIDSIEIAPQSLRGKAAYTHQPPASVFERAVTRGEAAGIVSSYLPDYNRPAEHPSSISMSSIPYVDSPSVVAFKISYASQVLLDSLLRQGKVEVHASVLAQFTPKIVREVSVEIVGQQKPEEIVVLIAHVDEPGANDNASGCGALLEMALTLRRLIASGELPRPARTLKFMWVEEIATVRRWQKSTPRAFDKIKAALVLDMVGEDIVKTGGSFLIEKTPDPSAIWTRPPDEHTEWGQGEVAEADLRGSFLNDLFYAACEARAPQTQSPWLIKTNPFEGGSDHVPFVHNGIPAILAWHFTDVYYHTSNDDIDKVSASEMANVGASVAATALFLANCSETDAVETVRLLSKRAAWRIANETQNNLRSNDSSENRRVLQAWLKWYEEAFDSVASLNLGAGSKGLAVEIRRAQVVLNRLANER